VRDHYEQYTLKFNKSADQVLMSSIADLTFLNFMINSIENLMLANFINEFDMLTSADTTNQPISIDNENEETFKNAVFYI
jgi:hypothetical protein